MRWSNEGRRRAASAATAVVQHLQLHRVLQRTTCLGGASSGACGAAGAQCLHCGPTGLCASGLCASGRCTLDPASRWDLVLLTIEVQSLDQAGEAWDTFGGAPDPFVMT